ncbi:MAG: hypothetical protein ACPGVD_07975, partial [Flavobacteriales bacterium]
MSIFFLNKYSDKSYQDDTILQEGLNNLTFSSSFSSGYSGLFWMIAHLENKDLLNIDRDIFDEFDKVIEDFIAYKDFSEYDFLHG